MVGIIFCGGMPLMVGLSFIGIITRYIYFKFIFIRFSKVPKTIDEALNETVLTYFPWMMILHFGVSIWMFGDTEIFQSDSSYFSTLVIFNLFLVFFIKQPNFSYILNIY
jgi:hypothetical protein